MTSRRIAGQGLASARKPMARARDESPGDAVPPAPPVPVREVGPPGLPIFRLDSAAKAVFHVPGTPQPIIVERADAEELTGLIAHGNAAAAAGRLPRLAAHLRQAAAEATAQRSNAAGRPFRPECLTVLPTRACNLRCGYCHSSAGTTLPGQLRLDAVLAAAHWTARNCRRKGMAILPAVFHGGGEPSLVTRIVDRALDGIRAVANAHGLGVFTYIATNGVCPPGRALWMAQRFGRVGLSCDGPPEIQDRQRPARGGGGTADAVERTARILREEGCPVLVRATVTELSVEHLVDVVDYFVERLGAGQIAFEPLYRRGRGTDTALLPPEPEAFVEHLLRARRRARRAGVSVEFPDARTEDLHGPFCHPSRDVLALTPDGDLTACFDADGGTAASDLFAWAKWDRHEGRFRLDRQRLRALRRISELEDPACSRCFNRFHCARGCPECCPIRNTPSPRGGRRCQTALLWTCRSLVEETVP